MGEPSPLPRSLDPLPDEALPGYGLRLAHRLGLSPARVLRLTGLTAATGGHQPAPRSLMTRLDAVAAGSFARATRLTAAEVSCLCMSSMSGRYPQAAPVITSGRPVTSPWVFTSATRYCPQCLAGDGSPVQQQYGGAWRKTWRLPAVFACPPHQRLLEHLCPSCGQPAMSASPGSAVFLIPHSTSSGLHPAQCRAVPRPERGARARLCQARLDNPAEAPGTGDYAVPGNLLALQTRLLTLLQPEGPATVSSVGRPATAAQYFADLRLVCSLISGAWPATRNLIPAPGLADAADHYITGLSSASPRPCRLCDTQPLDPLPGAALIAAAARILDGDDLRVISEFVTPARDGAPRKSPRGRWIRRYQRAGHDCSDGFRDALDPLVNTFQHADQRSRGRRAPARQISFAPEHIPEHLQDDWFRQHFRHIGGNTRLLRRAAALRLVQMSAGGSLAEAAAFLGIDHRYIAASPGSSAFAGDPAEFRLAVHALATELSVTPALTDYKHRREALRTWCIDPATWQDIAGQLPRTKGPFQPELSDCKRQFATEVVWARVTQGEHVMAPQLIEDQLSRPDPTWNRRRDNMWHFYQAQPLKPHYAALKEILNVHADSLAAQIDHQAAEPDHASAASGTVRPVPTSSPLSGIVTYRAPSTVDQPPGR